MSQMGFMVTECAVGAYLAAVVHLIGHALYKATLFFGSGSQVPRAGQAPTVPATAALPLVRATATVATTAATVGAMTAIPGMLAHRGATVLVIFAAATAASTSWSWSGRHPVSTRWMVLWVTSLVGAGTLYGLVLDGLEGWISPSLAFAGSGILSPWWLAAMAAAGVAAAGLTRLPTARRRVIAILVNLGTPPVQLLSDREREAQRCPCAPAYTFELPALWEESAA